jgi:chemosensory pili system protein ChpA (sensor histidine kinase/response regulator)
MDAVRPVVMVVDDDPLLRTCLAELLAEYGYDTLTECDGASALDLLDNLSPTSGDMPVVLLVDIVMPKMDGYQLAAALRSRGAVSTVPLIFMSSSVPDSPCCFAQDFLRKPFNVERLMAAIGRAIPARRVPYN